MISEKSQRQSFQIGPRAAFGLACIEIKSSDVEDLTVFTADTHTSAGLARFKKKYPSSLIDVSIAEQILISASSSFALEGTPTIATTFAPFITMRGLEMIRHNLGYMKSPLVLVGLASGVALGDLGYTHCAIEDSALLSCIPNINIYSPSHPSLIPEILRASLRSEAPTYIRLTGAPGMSPWNLPEDYTFSCFPIIRHENAHVVVLSVGMITSNVVTAIGHLSDADQQRISLYAVSAYRPHIDDELAHDLHNADYILLVEEAVESAFYATFLLNHPSYASKIVPNVHPNTYLKPGSYDYMLNQSKLDATSIATKISSILANPAG